MKTSRSFRIASDRTRVIADASPVLSMGAVLVQFDKANEPLIITSANKSLFSVGVERRYAQTEKKALAPVWAVERFYYYLYGRTFELITDHKPLKVIFGSRSKPCLRIERLLISIPADNGRKFASGEFKRYYKVKNI